jgi:hypothetical protein
MVAMVIAKTPSVSHCSMLMFCPLSVSVLYGPRPLALPRGWSGHAMNKDKPIGFARAVRHAPRCVGLSGSIGFGET